MAAQNIEYCNRSEISVSVSNSIELDRSISLDLESYVIEGGYKEKKLENFGLEPDEDPKGSDKQNRKTPILDLIYKMIKNIRHTDVEIQIEQIIFKCHMLVLRSYSKFFRDHPNSGYINLPPNKVSRDAFYMLYEWMITPDAEVGRKGIVELYTAAEYLKVQNVLDQCWTCFEDDQRFNENTAFELFIEAKKFKQDTIATLMLSKINKFFLILVATKEFVELDVKDVCCLLSSTNIGVCWESEVLMAGVRWLNYNWEERKKHTVAVMSCVRFSLLKVDQVLNFPRFSEENEVIRVLESREVKDMFENALFYHVGMNSYSEGSAQREHFMQKLNMKPTVERLWITDEFRTKYMNSCAKRPYLYCAFIRFLKFIQESGNEYWDVLQFPDKANSLVGYSENSGSKLKDEEEEIKSISTIQSLTKKFHSSTLHSNNPKTRDGIRSRSLNDEHDTHENYFCRLAKKVENINPAENTVNEKNLRSFLAQYNVEREIPKIYIFGGLDPYRADSSQSDGSQVLVYNPLKDDWDQISSMPGIRRHHSAIYCYGKIYIVGGQLPQSDDFQQILTKSMWSFNPVTGEWRAEKDMPKPRRDFGITAIENGFLCIGGENSHKRLLDSVLFYDIQQETWSERDHLNIPRSGLTSGRVGNEIWAAGGVVSSRYGTITDTVESYNLSTDCWCLISPLKKPKVFAKLCITNSTEVYIIGGATFSSNKTFSSLDSVEKYEPTLNEWKKVATLSFPRHGHDAILLENRIYIFGGISFNESRTVDEVECLLLKELQCKNVSAMPKPLSGIAAVLINNNDSEI